MKVPCENCITFVMCKQRIKRHHPITSLKCVLLNKYIYNCRYPRNAEPGEMTIRLQRAEKFFELMEVTRPYTISVKNRRYI